MYIKPGLTSSQVADSRINNGDNSLTQRKRKGFLKQYLSSFGDPIIKILLVALALNVIFLFRDANWLETAGIAIAVFLATFVSTLSEYGSESAFIKLMDETQRIQCRVLRDGNTISVPINEIVVGDIVLLQAGEKIPADGIIISGKLKIDQSALNGESKEIEKLPDIRSITEQTSSWDLMSSHQLFRGSVVDEGEGVMEVIRVGDFTFYGVLAMEMQEESRESPLKIRLSELAKILSKIGYLAAAVIAFSDLFSSIVLENNMQFSLICSVLSNPYAMTGYILHAITLAIIIVVVAVPEGLPMMITVVLSSNMLRMLKDKVMVRKLVGIETAGSLNILFTDKTGTLTQGKLAVSHFMTGDGKIYRNKDKPGRGSPQLQYLALSSFYNTGSVISKTKPLGGNSTDRALLEYVMPLPIETDQYIKLDSIPFNSEKKYSAARISGKKDLSLIKGAPEKILPSCTHYYGEDGNVYPLSKIKLLEDTWHDLTANAIRVIVVAAAKTWPIYEDEFSNLILIGLIGIRDELRPEAQSSINQIMNAGVQVVMITGDNKDTAVAIARGTGLLNEYEKDSIITSKDLNKLSDEQLKQILPKLRVVARALPTDKSRLVTLAHELGMVTGMTGDGINDGPALKLSDVGFAMGDGTEVAKEAGDIVIMDNNIHSISKAILYGRTIFKSIQKFIIFQLTMNLCAVGVCFIGPFIGMETPITVIQMLWVNIIMDTLAGLAFAGEAPLLEYMEEPPKSRDEPVLNKQMLKQILFMGFYTIIICMLFLSLNWVKIFFHYSFNASKFLSAFFTLFIFCGIFNSFNARTTRINLTAYLSKNPAFIAIISIICTVQLILTYYGGTLFRTYPLSAPELILTIILAATVIPADMIRKIFIKKILK